MNEIIKDQMFGYVLLKLIISFMNMYFVFRKNSYRYANKDNISIDGSLSHAKQM